MSRNHRSAFAEPLFRRYFASSCFVTFGGWVLRFLFGWTAWDTTHSAFWVGVVASAMLLPTFILSPIFGVVSDRINLRNGLLGTISCHCIVGLGAAIALYIDALSLSVLVGLAVALGATASAHTPIRLALLPQLVKRQALPSAIGLTSIVFNTSRILGPAGGAWLLVNVSGATAFMVATALVAIALIAISTLPPTHIAHNRKPAGMVSELRQGLKYAHAHRGIRLILGFTLINGLLGRTAIELLPALSGGYLAGDASTLATLTASAGAGSILGGLFISREAGNESRLLSIVMVSLACGALALMLMCVLSGTVAVSAIVMAIGMITTMVGTGCQALAQLRVDDSFRGRVLSLWTVLAMGTPALGALMLGALAEAFGFPLALLGFGSVGVVATLLLARKRRWLMQTERRGQEAGDDSV